MIFGENGMPTSNRAKKQVVRALKAGYYPNQVMGITSAAKEPTISFGAEDLRTLMYPHDDALVFTTNIAMCRVHRVFVDSGSAVNILYLECLQKMGIEANIEPTNSPLFGFGGEIVMPLGFVELPVTLGRADACKNMMTRFLVVDMPSPSYNVILGRPALTAFRAVISMFHLKMKFPLGDGRVGEVWGDQRVSKECHVKMLSHSSGQKRERVTEGPDTRKKGKVGEVHAPAEERQELAGLLKDRDSIENIALVSTSDVCNMIELFPGKEGFQTKIGSSMSDQVREELISCLRRNADVFAFRTADLKGIDRGLREHCLNVDPRVKPVKQRMRNFGAEKDAAIREQVQGLLEAGHIEEVQYPEWISNVVMVPKKTNTWRMCVDFRDLNAACPKDHYPLPRIDQLVDSTSGCALLSMMDAYQRYHQVKMNRGDIAKTAFAVCCGVYGWRSMPFGLKNAGATYQRMMEKIFKEQLSKNISVYVDDMLVRNVRVEDHVSDLEEIFTVIRKHRLMFISRSAERSMPFFKILRKGTKFLWTAECRAAFEDLKVYLAKLPTLTKPVPGETLYLYIAVGEDAISSVLIREEGSHQKPIYFVSRIIQGPELNYTEIEKAALAVMVTGRKLRPYFLSHRVVVRFALPFRQGLGRPDLSGRMVKWAVELGEYDVEYEPRTAIKAQALADFIQETTRRPMPEFWVAFVDGSVTNEGCGIGVYIVSPGYGIYQFAIKFTCRMSNNEAKYEAVVRGAHILSELKADCVIIKTNSQLVAQQLSGAYNVKDQRMKAYHCKISEMRDKFMEFKIEQISRDENTKADLLARMASAVEQTWNDEIILLCDTREMGTSQVFSVEIGDDWWAPIMHFLKTGERLNRESNQRARYENYCLINDQLYKRSFTQPLLKCLSPEEANFALKEIHAGCCGGHTGFRDLVRKIIRAGFYWPNINKEAREFVRKCEACQRHAGRINIPGETMGVMYAACPFDKWGIDIVGKLPTAPGGKCFLLVAVDYFSKWVEAEAMGKIDEVTVERFIWRNICCRFGVPRIIIVSDNGTQFIGQRIADFCDRMDITQRFVSVAHPQANGQVELANRTICDGIKKRLNQSRGKWVEELDTVLWAYRTSPKTTTGEAPFTLVYGSNAVIPAEARLESYRITTYNTEHNAELRRAELDLVEAQRDEARVRAAKYKSIIKAGYDKRVRARKLSKGVLVLKRADALKAVGMMKL
ncbi:uncharacterized protein LOC130990511 [Salvia miltiorrhiza]|uniref:uncharacterized protein LOC130990511 n=1 Tax=Salvia miltiorrhiza TaxID=226208 RepID=UPI0025AC5B8F|nr:uncharacterized protein LOC130990511 [Salvia miltiorrhiza]